MEYMIRTQVYLTTTQRKKIGRSGKPLAAFVREAVDEKLKESERIREECDKALEAAFGAWKDRDFTGDEYQVQMRRHRSDKS